MPELQLARQQLAQLLAQNIEAWSKDTSPTITRKDQALLSARRELAGFDPIAGGAASETFARFGLPVEPPSGDERIKRILATAVSQLGTLETPKKSNITPYTIWYSQGIGDPAFKTASWCAMFVSWVFWNAGYPLPRIESALGFAYCPAAENWAKRNGKLINRNSGRPGDIVLYDWEGNGVEDHTGIVESVSPEFIVAIEGNTSGNNAGSQSNGDGVYRRRRPISLVAGFIRL